MNAREFATSLLATIAESLPPDVTVPQDTVDEVEELVTKFLTPTVPVMKIDEDQRMVYGWASVISKNGQPIIDRQGDVIEPSEMRSAIHDFMKHRTGGEMHGQTGGAEVVESLFLDRDVQQSLGIDLGMEGWYVGMHVPDDAAWEKIRAGTYKAFSIGGSANRESIPDADMAQYLVVKNSGAGKAINDGTPSADAKSKCPRCGKMHAGTCPMKKSMPTPTDTHTPTAMAKKPAMEKCAKCGKNASACGCKIGKKARRTT